jgi:ABC transporter substrate binding protein
LTSGPPRPVAFIRVSVVLLTAVLLGTPVPGETQPATRQVKIGVLCAGVCPFPVPPGPSRPLIRALERVGLVQGRTLTWDFGGVINSEDRLAVEARNLVARRPDLILVWPGNTAAARAARDATRTIPIVLMAVPDVVEHGLVESLARPGGNICGTSVPSYDLMVKQLQVLKEIDPRLRRLVVVQGDLDRGERETVNRLRGAAASLQLDAGISVTDASTVEHAFTAADREVGILVIGNIPHVLHRRIRTLALERKVPFITPWRPWEGGGSSTLVAYGPHFSAVAERTAFITIPPSVRARADEVLD